MPHRILAHETWFYTVCAAFASIFSGIGAIAFSDGTRWFFVTLAVSIMTACFLSLRFRPKGEEVAAAVGRGGLSVMGAIFGTRGVIHAFNLDAYQNDMILLGLLSMGVCIAVFFVGMGILVALDKSAGGLGVVSLDAILKALGLERTKKTQIDK